MKHKSLLKVLYFSLIYLCAAVLVYYSITTFPKKFLDDLPSIFIFALLLILAELLPVHLPEGAEVTVGFAIGLSSLLIFGPQICVLIAMISAMLTEFRRKANIALYKSVFNISLYIVMVGVSGILYEKSGGIPGTIHLAQDFPRILLLAFTYLFINVLVVTIALALLENENVYHIFVSNFKWALPNYLALAPLGILLAMIYLSVGSWGILLFLIPLLVARHSFQLYMTMRKVYFETIQALATAIEAKDPYTKGHSERVAEYATIIAQEMKLPENEVNNLNFAALLHDIGKIAIPEDILNKPDKLTKNEFDIVKSHSIMGASIVEKIDFLMHASSFIRYHHEREDGSGYPEGLTGDQIPLGASILAVADTFDALTTDRPYRTAWGIEETMEEIEKCAGTKFKQEVVLALKNAIKKGRIRLHAH